MEPKTYRHILKQVATSLGIAVRGIAAHAPDKGSIGTQQTVECLMVAHTIYTIPLKRVKSDRAAKKKSFSDREETEDGGAAASHGGVEGTAAVHVVFQGCDGGMCREN